MTIQQINLALELLENFNMEMELAKEIGEKDMYGTDETDASNLGYGVFYNTDKNQIEIWKNITTENRGWAKIANSKTR